MRVGIFTDNDFGKINGVTTTLKAVLDHVPDDVTVRVYTASRSAVETPGYLALRAPAFGIPFYEGMDMCAPRFGAFLRAAQRDRLDVVHYTTPGPMGLVAQYVAWRLRLPMVGSFHTLLADYAAMLSGSQRLGDLMAAYLRWPYGRCLRVLVPSAATRDQLVAARIAPDRLHVWSRGVDTVRFDPNRRSMELRRAWGAADGRPVVVYAGRLSVEKGLLDIPALWRYATAAGPARLVIAGDGPLRAELQRRLPEATFTGPLTHDALAVVMASADAFLFPSRTDTLGNVVLEAQASGLPVLVSDAGGPQENLVPGHSGFVCRPGAMGEGFEARLAQLVASADLRARLSLGARHYALQRTWKGAMQPLFQTWREAGSLAQRSPAGRWAVQPTPWS
jgi:glycosyltransferase involved in cell wall biosynthesis